MKTKSSYKKSHPSYSHWAAAVLTCMLILSSCQKTESPISPDPGSPTDNAKIFFERKSEVLSIDTIGMSYRQKLERTVLWQHAYVEKLSDTIYVFAPVEFKEHLFLKSGGIAGTSFNENTWLRASSPSEDDWHYELITLLPADSTEAFTGVAIVDDWFSEKSAFSPVKNGKPISVRQLKHYSKGKSALSIVWSSTKTPTRMLVSPIITKPV